MATIVATIRDAGARQPGACSAASTTPTTSASGSSSGRDRRPADRGVHGYDFKECAAGCWDQAPIAQEVPLLTAELGPAARSTSAATLGVLATLLVGVLVWADHPSDPMSLLRDADGRPTAYGRLARTWLTDHDVSRQHRGRDTTPPRHQGKIQNRYEVTTSPQRVLPHYFAKKLLHFS